VGSAIVAAPTWIRGYRLVFGLAALATIAVQFEQSLDRDFSPVSFFSYFTIQSNVIEAIVLLIGARRSSGSPIR
jgi:hypothetical protein